MQRFLFLVLLGFVAIPTGSAQAQLFSKKVKAAPQQRVPELILIVKTDADERKRISAAEELREFDAKMFGEIVPVLVDVLQNDKSSSVRYEALDSLSRLRPVTPLAGQALEKAQQDENWRVRWHAKTSLMRYQWAGYTPTKTDPVASKTVVNGKEPPLAENNPPPTIQVEGQPTIPTVQLPPIAPPPAFPRPLPQTAPAQPVSRPMTPPPAPTPSRPEPTAPRI
jgi:hypothetical protein